MDRKSCLNSAEVVARSIYKGDRSIRKNRSHIPALPFCGVTLKGQTPNRGYPEKLETWGDHIKKKRLDLDLTQKEVAIKIGSSAETIRYWETNRGNPSLLYLTDIIKLVGYVPYDPSLSRHRKLRIWRRVNGLSIKRLAQMIKVDESTLTRWEHGKIKPQKKLAHRLLKFYEMKFK